MEIKNSTLENLQCCKCGTRIPGLKYAARHSNSARNIDVMFFYQFAPQDTVSSLAFSDIGTGLQVIEKGTPMIQMLEFHSDQGKYFCCSCVSDNPQFVKLALALESKSAIVNDDMTKFWTNQPKSVKKSLF